MPRANPMFHSYHKSPYARALLSSASSTKVLAAVNLLILFCLTYYALRATVRSDEAWRPYHPRGFKLSIGIMTTVDHIEQRALLRYMYAEQLRDPFLRDSVDMYFVVGQGGSASRRYQLQKEQELHQDIIELELEETGHTTKTLAFFKEIERRDHDARRSGVGGRIASLIKQHRFYMKTDDDTFMLLRPIVETLQKNADAHFLYYGIAWPNDERDTALKEALNHNFMLGMGYTISADLLYWLNHDDAVRAFAEQVLPNTVYEDQIIGYLLKKTDQSFTLLNDHRFQEIGDPGWHPKFDDHFDKTILLHLLKSPEEYYRYGKQLMATSHRDLREPVPMLCQGACLHPPSLPFL